MEIKYSERLLRLPPYLFGKLNEIKIGFRQEGKDIIDFGMGNPDHGAPKEIVDKTKEVLDDPKTHRYSVSKGIPHLLKEVSIYYEKKYDVRLDPKKEILATIGSKEGISHLSLALLGPGDSVLVPSPSFPIHIWSPIIAGANVITVPLEENWEDFLRKLFSTYKMLWPKPKAMLLNFPHNPTTSVVDKSFFEEMIRFALKNEVILIHDFAYADITFDGYTSPSFLQIPNAKKVGVEFITMSKSFSMAGWRIGFCLGNAAIVNALQKIKGYYDYGIFTPVQIGSIIGLRELWKERPEYFASIYEHRRNVLVEGLNKVGWEVTKPKATMFAWAPIPENYKHVGSIRFSQFLLHEADVCVSPGIGFGAEGEGYLRIALVENEARIQQAIRQIKRAMQNVTPEEIIEKYTEKFA